MVGPGQLDRSKRPRDKTLKLMKNLRREISYLNSIHIDWDLTLSQGRRLRFVETRQLPLPTPKAFSLPISQACKPVLRAGRPPAQGHAAAGPEPGPGRAPPRNPPARLATARAFLVLFTKLISSSRKAARSPWPPTAAWTVGNTRSRPTQLCEQAGRMCWNCASYCGYC